MSNTEVNKKAKRILAISSGGGHWVQLLRTRAAFKNSNVTYVTVRKSYSADVPGEKFRVIRDATRWNKFGLVIQLCQIIWIVLLTRPHVIISTGASPGVFAIRMGKLIGSRTCWLDSIANADETSMSGKMIKPYADLWLTQWPHLATEDGPFFNGSVIEDSPEGAS